MNKNKRNKVLSSDESLDNNASLMLHNDMSGKCSSNEDDGRLSATTRLVVEASDLSDPVDETNGGYWFRTHWTTKKGNHPSRDHHLMNPLCNCNLNQRKPRPRRSMILSILKTIHLLMHMKAMIGTSFIANTNVLVSVLPSCVSIRKIIGLNTKEIQNTPTNVSREIMVMWSGWPNC